MLDRPDVTRDEVISYLRENRNWGRWGEDDELGALNLIDGDKRRRAAGLVRTGQSLSLSRPLPTRPAPNNRTPGMMHVARHPAPPDSGVAVDFQGMSYHGATATHIDALCHVWNEDGMWNGREADEELVLGGSQWGTIDRWKQGIFTRGVLIDVPAFRNEPYVTEDTPVHGWELEQIVEAQGVTVEPGDALTIYCGRDDYERDHGGWGSDFHRRPGLEATCLQFIRESDCAVLVWDMFDRRPSDYGVAFTTHAAIFSFGVAVIDNAYLEPLSQQCRETNTYEFLLSANPLYVEGATGSLVNPVATF